MLRFLGKYWGRILVVLAVGAGVAVWHLFPSIGYGVVVWGERARAGLYQASVELDGATIAYMEGGAGDPLLLLHGFAANKDHWTRVAEFLTPHYRIIAPDLPGFGDSDLADGGDYSIAVQARRIVGFADTLGLNEFHLGGSSMGGNVAGLVAASHPDRVQSLWLLAPLGVDGAQPSEIEQRLAAGEDNPLLIEREQQFGNMLGYLFVDRPWIPTPIKRHLARQAAARYHHYHWIHDQIRASGPGGSRAATPLQPYLQGLDLPTLIVWGEDDRVLDVSGAAILAVTMPDAEVALMAGVGHLPMLEQPQPVATRYLQFRGDIAPRPVPGTP